MASKMNRQACSTQGRYNQLIRYNRKTWIN